MQPTDIFPHIKIVRLKDCVAHEGVVARWVEQIATNIRDQGVMKSPIIVTKPVSRASYVAHRKKGVHDGRRTQGAGRQTQDTGCHIVIDGMHRFAAFQRLEIPDIVAYEIDYEDPTILLEGWDALVFRPFAPRSFLQRLFPTPKGFDVHMVPSIATAQTMLDQRGALIAAVDQQHRCWIVTTRRRPSVDALVRASEDVDRGIDAAGLRPVYVADSLALGDFRKTRATGLIIRPHYTKQEIIARTLGRRLFPRKSTRHLIPGRPLRLDVPLTLLQTTISLRGKNQFLDAHLRWCYAADRMRYYPESVFIFAD